MERGAPGQYKMNDDAHDGTTSQARDRVRVIRDDEYREWTVREVPPTVYDRRHGNSLVFINSDVMRRVRSFPADWYELSDADLYAVSLGR